ncbi:MAG: acetate kinase [Mariprofundales bacterium]
MSTSPILVINSGSSTVKMALVAMEPQAQVIAEVMRECSGDIAACVADMVTTMLKQGHPAAIGHRVVHGGERFVVPTLLDDAVIAEIEALSWLAPLHNPANLQGIGEAMRLLPNLPHVAVFDTAFHHAMPPRAFHYAVPRQWYETHGVRRYGFHGSSHHFVALEAAARLDRPLTACRLLTAHLGNGCSAAAIADGVSIDTTMGMTPLEGLVMGSRSGDLDPGVHQCIAERCGISLAEVTQVLNRESGLLGLSGISNDMRALLEAEREGNPQAALAIDLFCYRLAKSLAALAVALGRVDAIVFTGGIGEHAAPIRARTVDHLTILGARLDEARNCDHGGHSRGRISPDGVTPALMVIPTSEERMIASHTRAVVAER